MQLSDKSPRNKSNALIIRCLPACTCDTPQGIQSHLITVTAKSTVRQANTEFQPRHSLPQQRTTLLGISVTAVNVRPFKIAMPEHMQGLHPVLLTQTRMPERAYTRDSFCQR
eukprot:jgi/Ulvmu1/9228/UM005_0328.1